MSRLKLNLKKIDALQWAKIVGILYGGLALVLIVPMMLIFGAISASGAFPEQANPFAMFGGGIAMAIFLPIIYGIMGFIMGFLITSLLNFMLKKLGGLDLDFDIKDSDIVSINEIGTTE